MKIGKSSVDYRALVSRADITYFSPTTRPEEGLPIGNGRMGTLVWTTNNSLNLQVNRVDVFAQDSYSESGGSSDYCGGCGKIEVGFGKPVFKPDKVFKEHLSLYDGLVKVSGDSVKAEVFTWSEDDVIGIRIDDKRKDPLPINVDLRMLRPVADHERQYYYKATSSFQQREERIFLVQEFSEKNFHCHSALGVDIIGREIDREKSRSTGLPFCQRIVIKPGLGPLTILISTSASFDKDKDIILQATGKLKTGGKLGFERMFSDTKNWWNDFWKKSFLHLHSSDGVADFLERCYTYHMYLMASSSRGKLPPKFNGMLWITNGDEREWGAQYWLFNEETMYYPLPAANHLDLTDPYFNMYSKMLDNAKVAAKQRWGSKGIFIPETVAFNGPETLPEEFAEMVRSILLGQLPYDKMPEDFHSFGISKNHLSHIGTILTAEQRWSWILAIVSGAAELGLQYWQRYQITGDKEWLQGRAYPMIKGAVEFYRNFPKMRREQDGLYHLYDTNVHETFWGVKDSIFDLAALRGVIPLAIRASKILGVDEDLCSKWKEFLDHLAPYPLSEEKDSAFGLGPGTWAASRKPTATDKRNVEQVWLYPVFFEDWTLETKDETMKEVAQATYESLPDRKALLKGEAVANHSRLVVLSARMGRRDDVKKLLPVFVATTLYDAPNALSLWEGVQAMTSENLGLASYALQEALLQSLSPKPGQPSVIHLYPAWPGDWDAQFCLLARGSFMVTSEFKEREIQFVNIKSLLGKSCLLRNPWSEKVGVYRNGKFSGKLSGKLLELPTSKDEEIMIVPEGKDAADLELKVSPPQGRGVWKLNIKIGHKELDAVVGRY